MTVGENGGRDYGHDDQSYSPYYSSPAAGYPEPVESSWDEYPTGRGYPRGDDGYRAYADGSPADNRGWGADGFDPEAIGGWSDNGYRPEGYRMEGDPSGRHRSEDDDAGGYDAGGYYTDESGPWDGRFRQAGYGDAAGYQDAAGWGTGYIGAGPADMEPGHGVYGDPRFDGEGAWDTGHGTSRRDDRRRSMPLWQELPLLLIIAFCLAVLIRTFLMQAFYIPSGSMEDTLVTGDRVLVNKLVYHFREPARGEIVVFRGTDAWAPLGDIDDDAGVFARVGRTLGDLVGISRPGEKDYIKRIVGLPGDRVSCCDDNGRIYVNGQPLEEDYVIRDSPLDVPLAQDCQSRRFDEVVVELGQMFVLGDHRLVSQDSRCQGQVPLENVVGRAFVIVWPNSRWTSLPAPQTFTGAPSPTAAASTVPMVSVEPTQDQLPLVLPVLLPLPLTFASTIARSRLFGKPRHRRLAE